MNRFKVGDVVVCTVLGVNGLEQFKEYTVEALTGSLVAVESINTWYDSDFFTHTNQPFERVPPKFNTSGSKYLRDIKLTEDGKIDVYAVLIAFNVTSPARQHAIKKLLCSGLRGKNDELNDVKEAGDAIERDIQLMDN